jgi:AmmeMemoRadiSam system protein B
VTDVRNPAVVGQFYAGREDRLREQIEAAFEHPIGPGSVPAEGTDPPMPLAIVSPHAGYPYSGPVAAHGFERLTAGGRPDAVVIAGPNHGRGGAPIAVSKADAWETPLGTVPVATELRDVLLDHEGITVDELAHDGEHSIEVQVPLLQFCFEEPVPILPIVMTRQDRDRVEKLSSALAAVREAGDRVVLVASTDLTHYESDDRARELDTPIREAVTDLDAGAVLSAAASGHSMCGAGPTAAVLRALDGTDSHEARVLQYATSGDTAGEPDSVVGYLSAAVLPDAP